jgi:23S rRNA G2445 N2-methylase RlmL
MHVDGSEFSLSIDLVGYPLHRRGIREEAAEGAMKENRAAALLYFAGFERSKFKYLIDPFCGGGTILSEAYLIDTNTAPALSHLKPQQILNKLSFYTEWKKSLEEKLSQAKSQVQPATTHFIGIEKSSKEFEKLKQNLRQIPKDKINLYKESAEKIKDIKQSESLIVSNPPHGKRILDPEKAQQGLKEFVTLLKHHLAPCRLALQLSNDKLTHAVGLRAEKKLSIKAGEHSMIFSNYEIISGQWQKNSTDK